MYETVCLLENGIGIGEGNISLKALLEANPDIPQGAIQLAYGSIDECIVAIERGVDSDGCGDGRLSCRIYRTHQGHEEVLTKNKVRPKVLGGGLPVYDEMLNAIDPEVQSAATIAASRMRTAEIMDEHGISYGAHTAQARGEGKCGCGCLDESAAIIDAQVRYDNALKEFITALLAEPTDQEDYNKASQSSLRRNNTTYTTDAQGVKTLEIVKQRGKIIKDLAGSHNETFIIIIDEPGKDFDQGRLFEIIASQYGPDIAERIQAFVVNLAHIRELAEKASDYVIEKQPQANRQELQRAALYAGIRHQLATAIVLTDGTHPVFMRRAKQQVPAMA